MEDSKLLKFNNFLKNSMLDGTDSRNRILNVIKTYYKLKHKNELFVLDPKKKNRIVPDFEAMAAEGYDETANPGKIIETNLPLKFEENINNLKLSIRDHQNTKNIIEINIGLNLSNLTSYDLANIDKELLLYKINSVKNKKNMIESLSRDSEKEGKLTELKEYWSSLKNQVEKFTKEYSGFIEAKHLKDKSYEEYYTSIIKSINRNELINFENNLLISSLTNSHSDEVTNTIQYYIIINMIINKYNKTISLINNKPVIHDLIGSLVYNRGIDIDKDNIFIVVSKNSDSIMDIIDINGNKTRVSIDSFEKIYSKLKTGEGDIVKKIDVESSSLVVTKNIIDKKIKIKHKGPIKYSEKKRRKKNISYNDIINIDSVAESGISQEIIKNPKYKLVTSLNSLDEFIHGASSSEIIYIYPNIFHRDIGDGYINALKGGSLVKENCPTCNDKLNEIADWRNKLTKSYINIYSKNGEILPIILDKKLFSSVAHYYLYYSNVDNKDLADQYLYNGKKGRASITPNDFDLDKNNNNWDDTDNILNIPNHIFELLRVTAAKFVQDENMHKILLSTNNITIINAYLENFLTGKYEISKELMLTRKYLEENKISEFYINYSEDLELSKKTRDEIMNKTLPQFITIKADQIIKSVHKTITTEANEDPIIYSETFTRDVNKKLQLKKLESYVGDILVKYLYNVPGDGNCLFYAIACSMYHHHIFDNLKGDLKLELQGTLVAEICDVIIKDRFQPVPILKKTALALKNIVSEIIQYNYDEYLEFFKKNKISDELSGIDKLEKMDMVIQENATVSQTFVLNFVHNLLLDIEHSKIYSNIEDYIQSIATDANKIVSYEKGWGGYSEIKILSALLCLDINTYPSNSAEIDDLENYYGVKYKNTSKTCLIPPKYKMRCDQIYSINIGYLKESPQHYMSIIDTDDLDTELQTILEDTEEEEASNLQKLLNMGYDLELAGNALRLNQNNIEMALNYIFRSLQTGVDLLESGDMHNFKFQTNTAVTNIKGSDTLITQFHEGSENSYYQNYSFLEETHTYIQWLFPMSHQSRYNPDIRTVLKIGELQIMKEDDLVKDNLFKSLRTMMDFFGGNLERTYDYDYSNPVHYEVQSNENIRERLLNLNQNRHNSQRITRMLNYLNSMEEYKLQYTILHFFIEQIFLNKHKINWHKNIIDSVYNYWLEEVSDINDAIGGFIHDIEAYKKLVKIQESTIQTGGANQYEPLENNYMMFPYKYRKGTYNIVYVIPNTQKGGGKYKKTTILGIMHTSGKLMLEKNINKETVLYKVLSKVSDKIFKNKLRIPKKKFKKLEYMKNIANNNIVLNKKIVGKMGADGNVTFN